MSFNLITVLEFCSIISLIDSATVSDKVSTIGVTSMILTVPIIVIGIIMILVLMLIGLAEIANGGHRSRDLRSCRSADDSRLSH